ncbi:MAG: HTH-type transcriptional activator RhaS [Lentisphaerae bacterium ADurb.Bin242]|nr:MAG: HTH-type transcriptional activator RhaS [Lentisphaerae bacterium ADurb.Bin242]
MRIRKQTDLFGSRFFGGTDLPLKIYMHDYKSATDKWHRHNEFYELVIVCSGTAHNENTRRSESVHAGNVFLFPSGSVHRYTGIRNFCHYNILFQPSLLKIDQVNLASLPGYPLLFQFQFEGEDRCSPLLSVDETVLSRLVSMIETILNECDPCTAGWRESAYFEFMRMLVCLLRYCVPQDVGIGQNAFQIGRAIRAMEKDCARVFTLKSLADEVHMSPSSFRHHFTEITGIPPGEYLLKLRIRKAILMLTSPTSVSSVALQSGFRDNNYFSRQFRKKTGLSPREFQKKYRNMQITVQDLLAKLSPLP